MKPLTSRIFSHPGSVRIASKQLLALTLSLFALPCLLSAQTLLHRYSFVSDASDSVGTANGTIVAPNGGSAVTISDGLTLPGGGANNNGYVSLPSGLLTNTASLTVECWLTQAAPNTWGTPWDFAIDNNHNFALIPHPGNNNNNMEVAFTPHGNEVDLQSGTSFPNGSEEYVSVTFNSTNLVGNIYLNGALDATTTFPDATYTPGTIGGAGGTTVNALGNDIYNDPQFQGTIYEFRIWNGVVSQRYIAASQIEGPGVLVSSSELTPTSASMTVNSTNLVITGTAQAAINVQLALTGSSELLATGDATNWTSSNPSVLKVNSSGFITGVGPGTATVSATIAGVTSTSPAITVVPQTLIHRYSFISDATDSVGGANGTLVAGTTGAPATIANGLMLPGNTSGGNGYSGYLSLPAGILTNTTSLTIETWVTQNQGNQWAEIWDFGTNSQAYNFALIPDPALNSGNMEVGNFDNDNNDYIASSTQFPNGTEQYVAVTYNNSSLVGNLYTNGALIATENYPSTAYAPGTYGGVTGTENNYLGNDIYGDYQFDGTIYEFRIWNGAVSPVYLAASAVAGPGTVITNTTPQGSLSVSVNTTMLGSQTQQATVTGNFIQVNDVNLTQAITNWVSSNPSILTVNSSGLITAISGGTAAVTATVNGVSGTSSVITVESTAPTVQQKPANTTGALNSSASFSVSALGGSLDYQWSFDGTAIAGATNNTLSLTDLSYTNAGTYSVLISNTIGSTNLSATLTVVPAVLLHRYSFISDASDSVGGANGKIVVNSNAGQPATINNGLTLPGGGGGGYSGYVALPPGILTNTASLTVEVWVTQSAQNAWGTIWDFGNNGNQNFELCPYPASGHNNQDMISAFTPNSGEDDLDTATSFPVGTEQYVAETVNSASLVADLYTNGVLDGTLTLPNTNYIPANIGGAGGTTENWLGNDVYGDQQFQGTIYELRIWNGAVTPVYLAISAIAGPGVVVTNFVPQSIAITVTNSSMVVGTTQPATAIADFVNASGVPITSVITNWTSSDPSVLTVNSNGIITAVSTGSATVSGTYDGTTGTSADITVPNSPPIITVQPESSEDLLSGANLSASVTAVGNLPVVYRWYNGATLVSVSTNSSALSVPGLAAGTYTYTVVVSNAYGTATSQPINLTVTAPTPYEQVVQELNPLGYWPLNEQSGTTAYDVIGGDNGTYTTTSFGGGSSFSLAQPGPSQAFFGDSSYSAQFSFAYVDIPEGPFNLTNAVTAVAWINLDAEQNANYDGAVPFGGVLAHGDNSWRLTVNGSDQPGGNDGQANSGDADGPAIIPGGWHMIAYTYTGTPGQTNNGSFYLDGVLVTTNTIDTTPTGNNLDVWIGGSPDYGIARLMDNANIAHAAVFNQALTAAQINGLYNGEYVAGAEKISISHSGSNVVLTWASGQLLEAPTLEGPWTTNSAATSPYTVPATSGNQFFRVLVSP